MRAGLAVLVFVAIALPGLARGQSPGAGIDASPAIPLHPSVPTILQFPDEIVYAQVNADVHAFIRDMYESNRIVAAACHGTATLLNAKLSDGSYLVEERRVTGFSTAEEQYLGQADVMPLLNPGSVHRARRRVRRGRAVERQRGRGRPPDHGPESALGRGRG